MINNAAVVECYPERDESQCGTDEFRMSHCGIWFPYDRYVAKCTPYAILSRALLISPNVLFQIFQYRHVITRFGGEDLSVFIDASSVALAYSPPACQVDHFYVQYLVSFIAMCRKSKISFLKSEIVNKFAMFCSYINSYLFLISTLFFCCILHWLLQLRQ